MTNTSASTAHDDLLGFTMGGLGSNGALAVAAQRYASPGTTYSFPGPVVTENNGNMLQAGGASAPASAPFRIANSLGVAMLLTGIRIRYGANGYTGSGSVTINGQVFSGGAGFDVNGLYRTVPFTPSTAVELPVGYNHNSASGSNHGALTGGFQGPVLTGFAGSNVFPNGNIARAELDYIVGVLDPAENYTVYTYQNGTVLAYEEGTGTVTDVTSGIPAGWTAI